MYINNKCDYDKAQRRYSRLFDQVEALTGRYSADAIREALTPAEAAEFRALEQALLAYDQQQTFYACLRSGDYRS